MKKINLLLICLMAGTLVVNAQNRAGEKVVSLNIGYSLTGGIIKSAGKTGSALNDSIEAESMSISTIPAISVAFDYGIGEVFSIGVMYSIQSFSGDIKNYSYTDINSVTKTESVNFSLLRNNISILPRFHYKIENKNIDLYSGLRLGYIFWGANIDATDPNFDKLDKFAGGRPNFGIVPIGARFYFNENFGGNFEVAIGAPYIASVGAQYRF